jgi:hypothetical protein
MPPATSARLRWPAAEAADRYRVIVRLPGQGPLLELVVDGPEAVIGDLAPGDGEWPQWGVQVLDGHGAWVQHVPFLEWPSGPEGPTSTLGWHADEATIHRVLVYDDNLGRIVIKAGTLGTQYVLAWSRLDPAHHYRWRTQHWANDGWVDREDYRPLVAPGGLRAAVIRQRERPVAGVDAKLLFLFTSDTEFGPNKMRIPDFRRGVEEQIWGRFPAGEAGIGTQMELLEAHGFRGTFFIDVFAEYWAGEDGLLQPVFDEILGRGHDVQLHVHPNPHLRFATDERIRRLANATTQDDPAAFRAALELALELFERRAGRLPVAYRAGAYRIFDSHFPILRELGITIDSSINPFKNSNVAPWLRARTQPFRLDGVLEIPISLRLHRRKGVWRVHQYVPQNEPPLQLPALEDTVAAASTRPATVCCIAHSVSFLRRGQPGGPDAMRTWNERWAELVAPDEYEISRLGPKAPFWFFEGPEPARAATFADALERLAARPQVEGISLGELAERYPDAWTERVSPVDPIPAYDSRAERETVLRTRAYDSSYLAHLEAAGG